MSGRYENQQLVIEQIRTKLAILPSYMGDFELILDAQEGRDYKTRLRYVEHVADFLKFFYLTKQYKLIKLEEVKRITKFDVMHWKRSIDYVEKDGKQYPASPATIATKISAVRKFYKCFEDVLGTNPIDKVKRPKIKDKETIVLEDNEFDTMFKNLDNGVGSHRAVSYQKNYIKRDMAIIYLLCCTGIRVEPLTEINIEDVDMKNRIVKVTSKGNKTSKKDLNDEAYFYLKEYLYERMQMNLDTDALFVSNRYQRINTNTVRIMVKKYTQGINKVITPHVFRKTFCTRVYEKEGDIKLVADLLDQSDIKTTSKNYILTNKKRKKSVVNNTNLLGNRKRAVIS